MKTRFFLTFVLSALLAIPCSADIPKFRAAAFTDDGVLYLIAPDGEEQILSDSVELTESGLMAAPICLSGNMVFYIDPSDVWRAIDFKGNRVSLFDKNEYPFCYDEETEIPYPPISAGGRFYLPDNSDGPVVWGCVDNTGKVVIPFDYSICNVSEDLVVMGGKEGGEKDEPLFIDKTTQKVICKPDVNIMSYSYFSEGLIWVYKDVEGEAYGGFVDKQGKTVVPFKYDMSYSSKFVNGRAKVMNYEGQCFYVDRQGNETLIDDDTAGESENTYPILSLDDDERYVFQDENGKVLFTCDYSEGYFKNGYCPVMLDEKWGFIDKTGKLVVPCKYTFVTSFESVD